MSVSARTSARGRATRIVVTSGKGGVGKTSLSVNVAVALSRLGHNVGLVDADFALGNVDVFLGLTPDAHLGSVLTGSRRIGDVTVSGPAGLRVVPTGTGLRSMTTLDDAQWARLNQGLDDLSRQLDFVFIDTAPGISNNVLDVIGLADYVMVVTTYDPAAVVDAYALVKVLSHTGLKAPIGVVVNVAKDAEEGDVVFRQISTVAQRFLGKTLRYDGYVLEDRALRDAQHAQMPVLDREASSPASRCIRRLACRLAASRPNAVSPWASSTAPQDGVDGERPCA